MLEGGGGEVMSDTTTQRFGTRLARVIVLDARTRKARIPYDVDRERERRRNRVANLGVPEADTTTGETE